jgi:hypothetical protein
VRLARFLHLAATAAFTLAVIALVLGEHLAATTARTPGHDRSSEFRSTKFPELKFRAVLTESAVERLELLKV